MIILEKGKIRNFFPGGNTARGFFSFYKYLPYQTDKTLILKGGPGTGKSTFMKKIGSELMEQGYDIEFHWCSSDSNSLDGIVIPRLKTAILDGTAPHMIDPEYPGVVEEIINLGEYWDRKYLEQYKQEIIEINNIIKMHFEHLYNYLKIARLLHQEWESYYRRNLNKQEVNHKSLELIEEILSDNLKPENNPDRHLFASAITPEGIINHFENLTAEINRRYILKGEPGTDKATIIKKIADTISLRDYGILYLHCGLDPDKLDAIIVSDLNTAIINGTPPHLLEATRSGDQIVDMLSCVNLTAVNHYHSGIDDARKMYNRIMEKAIDHLKQAHEAHDRLEKYYITATDFQAIEEMRKELLKSLQYVFIPHQ